MPTDTIHLNMLPGILNHLKESKWFENYCFSFTQSQIYSFSEMQVVTCWSQSPWSSHHVLPGLLQRPPCS